MNPELHFSTKTEILDWFKKAMPGSHSEYLTVQGIIKKSGFAGSSKLLVKEGGEPLENFLSFLTELNLAHLLLKRGVADLAYEANPGADIDFSFDNIDLSVKNTGTKKYERIEQLEVKKLKDQGGGNKPLTHKHFSNILLEVEKTPMGTFSLSRTETGHSGFLDSDIAQMSCILENIGKFENKIKLDARKKVLFFLSHTQDFNHIHAADIAYWYFGKVPKGYQLFFEADRSMYWKLFKQSAKKGNIDALVFVFPPAPMIWPEGSLSEVVQKRARVLVYTKGEALFKNLKNLFR